MSEYEELQKELELLKETRQNILEGGQEFQTRDGRVKQANLNDINRQIAEVKAQIADLNPRQGMNTETVLMKFNGRG